MSRTLWLASYPKSGNTWLRALLSAWLTAAPPRLDALVGRHAAARDVFDDATCVPSSDLTPDEIAILRPRVDELLDEESRSTTLCKVHDGFYSGPEGEPVISVEATQGAIYLVRDPRDVAVSLAHHDGRPIEWVVGHLSNPGAVRAGRTDGIGYQFSQTTGTWSDHVRSWVDGAPFPVHVVRYEDCLADPVGTFGGALEFAELKPVDDAAVALAVERSRFEYLSAEESRVGFRERPLRSTRFFREGRAGSWRGELTAEQARRIEQDHGEVMSRFGYL